MNKNTKKFVVALLSVLMVLSFMPTMAFAADTVPAPSDGHTWVLDKDASTPASHTSYGLNVWKCKGAEFTRADGSKVKIACTASFATLAEPTNHVAKDNPIQLSTDDCIKRLAEEYSLSAETVEGLYDLMAPYCYVFIKECKECGKLMFLTMDPKEHEPVKDTPDCAESFKCKFCGETVERIPTVEHDWGEGDIKAKNVCTTVVSTDPEDLDGLNEYEHTCKKCGEKDTYWTTAVNYTFRYYNSQYSSNQHSVTYPAGTPLDELTQEGYVSSGGYGRRQTTAYDEYLSAHVKHNVKPVSPQPTTSADRAKYIRYDGEYYEANTPILAPTCEDPGLEALVCPDCEMLLGTRELAKVDHTWTEESFPATCTEKAYKIKICSVCGVRGTTTYGDPALGHDYEVKVVTEPNHFADGITTITCKRCGDGIVDYDVKEFYTADELYKADNTGSIVKVDKEGYLDASGKDLYFIGYEKELTETTTHGKKIKGAIKVEDWKKGTHDYGKYEDFAEATCEVGALQAKKCACGYVNVHDVVEVKEPLGHDITVVPVAATCGAYGFKYDTCNRCKCLIDHATGKATDYTDEWFVAYDITQPKVAYGTPCTWSTDFVVIEPATPEKDGIKAIVCTVCGAIKEGSETPVPYDPAQAKEDEIKKADEVIKAASDVLDKASQYKASSVEAIKAAKASLDQAISSGTAADVARASAALDAAVKAAEKKEANTMTAKGKTVKAKANKRTTFKKAKAFTVKKAKGKVTFKKLKGNKKVTVSKSGKVTVKKGLKKGTYKIKVAVKAAGNDNYKAKTKKVTLKVKVK